MLHLLNKFSALQLALTFGVSVTHIHTEARKQRVLMSGDEHEFHDEGMKAVSNVLCKHYRITPAQLRSNSRIVEFAEPRKIAYFIMRMKLNKGASVIASYFNRTHGAVINSTKNVIGRMEVDERYRNKIKEILKELKL